MWRFARSHANMLADFTENYRKTKSSGFSRLYLCKEKFWYMEDEEDNL
jgi:hypothetical protein